MIGIKDGCASNYRYSKNLCISPIFLPKYSGLKIMGAAYVQYEMFAFRGSKLAGMGSQITLKTLSK